MSSPPSQQSENFSGGSNESSRLLNHPTPHSMSNVLAFRSKHPETAAVVGSIGRHGYVETSRIGSMLPDEEPRIVRSTNKFSPVYFHDNDAFTYRNGLASSNRKRTSGNDTTHREFAVEGTTDETEIIFDNQGAKVKSAVLREIWFLGVHSLPLAVTFFLQNSLVVASIFSVGHIGKIELGAVSLGSFTASVTGYAVVQGMATCLDTLCAQAYGAGHFELVGIYFQKCVVMTLCFFVPVLALWFKADLLIRLLVSSDPDREKFIQLSKIYLRILAGGMPGYTIFECGKRYLQAQNIFHASTIILVICAPINALLNYSLVWDKRFGIGFKGAPLGVAITDWLMALLLLFYAAYVDGQKCWKRPDWSVFKGWSTLLKLALPGILLVESEFLAFEILTVFSTAFGTTALAAQTILNSIISQAYQIPFAISMAVSTRVANYIGAGDIHHASLTAYVTMAIAIVVSSVDAFLLYVSRYPIARLLTSDLEVINVTVHVMRLGALMHIFDSCASILGGILRGQGRQQIAGYLTFASYYAIGVPLATLFAFNFGMSLDGLWLGLIVALLSICAGAAILIVRSNWGLLIEEAKNRDVDVYNQTRDEFYQNGEIPARLE